MPFQSPCYDKHDVIINQADLTLVDCIVPRLFLDWPCATSRLMTLSMFINRGYSTRSYILADNAGTILRWVALVGCNMVERLSAACQIDDLFLD